MSDREHAISLVEGLEEMLELDDLHLSETLGACPCKMSDALADITGRLIREHKEWFKEMADR